MLLKVFSIRDSKGGIYHPPFFVRTPGEAERTLTELANDGKSMISKYPTDFDLFYIGEYDDNEGKIKPLDTPQHVVKACDLLPPT